MINIYLDCEWKQDQQIFLVCYAYGVSRFGQVHGEDLNRDYILSLFNEVDGYVFVYGPDIAMLEKNFEIDIRNNYRCVNLLRVFRKYCDFNSYKLADLEYVYDIPRTSRKYKAQFWTITQDWFNPQKKKHILKYCREDVLNLIRLKKSIFRDYKITSTMVNKLLLK